jgi:hypothetical protein
MLSKKNKKKKRYVKRGMTKKKIVDLVAYAILLIHNNEVNEVMTDEQIDLMMQTLIKMFNNNEEEALNFIKGHVKRLLKDLESEQNAK